MLPPAFFRRCLVDIISIMSTSKGGNRGGTGSSSAFLLILTKKTGRRMGGNPVFLQILRLAGRSRAGTLPSYFILLPAGVPLGTAAATPPLAT